MMTHAAIVCAAEMHQRDLRDEVDRNRLAERVVAEARTAGRFQTMARRWLNRERSTLQTAPLVVQPKPA